MKAFVAFVLLAVGFSLKLSKEDALLAAQFGDEHRAYRQRVARLVPFVWCIAIALSACDGSYPDCASRGELFNAQGQCGQVCSDASACPDGQVCVSSQQCVDPHSNCSSFQLVCSSPQ